MTIAEPTTMLTDYALAGVSAYLSVKLLRQSPTELPVRLWGVAFACVALTALAGGTWHGFRPVLDAQTLTVLWKLTVYAVGVFDLLVAAGAILATVTGRVRTGLLAVIGLKFLVYAAWMVGHNEFRYVVFDSAGAMLVLLVLHGYALWARGDRASPWIIAAVLVSALAAAVQVSGFALHRHFNHNDLYHVIQIVAMVLFYQGGRGLRIYSAAARAEGR